MTVPIAQWLDVIPSNIPSKNGLRQRSSKPDHCHQPLRSFQEYIGTLLVTQLTWNRQKQRKTSDVWLQELQHEGVVDTQILREQVSNPCPALPCPAPAPPCASITHPCTNCTLTLAPETDPQSRVTDVTRPLYLSPRPTTPRPSPAQPTRRASPGGMDQAARPPPPSTDSLDWSQSLEPIAGAAWNHLEQPGDGQAEAAASRSSLPRLGLIAWLTAAV